MQNNIAIDIQQLSKKTKKRTRLHSFTYQLQKGRTLALCGGNGAGKSTLIRLLIGLLKPTTGSVTMHELDGGIKRKKYTEQIGYMPDHFTFQKSLTLQETIQFYATLKSIPKERYRNILEKVGLSEKLSEKINSFSKGMNQRLLLAQALLSAPDILILDEPTNGLDPYWVNQFCTLMLRAKEKGQTIVVSTHDLHVAERIADEVIFLDEGAILSQGAIQRYQEIGLYETFQQLYVNEKRRQRTSGMRW
ncbi:MAG TPA: ABC transporter ATP-binding protein [Virgibacillus sp.]|nr:ABC transporter ATP-binding protein [Virgibacillus sp.]